MAVEFDCNFWNYVLGSISVLFVLLNITQLILLIRCRRQKAKIESATQKLKFDIESGSIPAQMKYNRQDLDVLKIARKQGTPLPAPKGDDIENPYETIKPKENTLLAVRDSVSVRLKNRIMNRKGRNKIVTFKPEQFEVIPDSLEQITSEEFEIATNLPSTSRYAVESTYMVMHGSQKSETRGNHDQTTAIQRETSHLYAKCQKPPPLPRGSSISNVENVKASSYSQDHKAKALDKVVAEDEIPEMECDNEYDEDELYDKKIEKYNSACGQSLTSSETSKVQSETLGSHIKDQDSKPILPKKLSLKSQSRLFGTEHVIVQDVQDELSEDATPSESYDVLPSPRPLTTYCGNELVPPTPYCGRKVLYNKPSPTPSRKSNISEASATDGKKSQKSNIIKKLQKMEGLIQKSLRIKSKFQKGDGFDSSSAIGSLVQNSFYNPTGPNPQSKTNSGQFHTEERKPSLSDINRLQERLNMTDTSQDRLSSASSMATPPILRRTSSVCQTTDDE